MHKSATPLESADLVRGTQFGHFRESSSLPWETFTHVPSVAPHARYRTFTVLITCRVFDERAAVRARYCVHARTLCIVMALRISLGLNLRTFVSSRFLVADAIHSQTIPLGPVRLRRMGNGYTLSTYATGSDRDHGRVEQVVVCEPAQNCSLLKVGHSLGSPKRVEQLYAQLEHQEDREEKKQASMLAILQPDLNRSAKTQAEAVAAQIMASAGIQL